MAETQTVPEAMSSAPSAGDGAPAGPAFQPDVPDVRIYRNSGHYPANPLTGWNLRGRNPSAPGSNKP